MQSAFEYAFFFVVNDINMMLRAGVNMEQEFIENSVRTRLILSGMSEIEKHGVNDFSLRRVALAAQVSCAAPYRHFKDKEELISEIIKYICAKWELLCREIVAVFARDLRRKVIELAVANLRFWIANPNFRSVLMTVSHNGAQGLLQFDAPLMQAIEELCGVGEVAEMKKFTVRAMIYGSLALMGADGNRVTITENFRNKLEEEF